jgi:putative heme-binding domain-containing protein
MYFITGGRATQSGLYRVAYVSKRTQPKAGATALLPSAPKEGEKALSRREVRAARQARELREQLEAFHGRQDSKAIGFAWPHLASDDRFIRHAARVAIEWQPVEQWQERALAETNTRAGLTALLALARCGGRETQSELLRALGRFSATLPEELVLEKLRVIQLSLIRQGRPAPDRAASLVDELSPQYPAASEWLNRELVQLLLHLNAPDAIARTLDLLDRAVTQEEQVHYLYHLRTVRTGWTLPQRERYFNWFIKLKEASTAARHPPDLKRWFAEAGREYSDGSSYAKFLVNIRQDAIATLTVAERAGLQPLLDISLAAPEWKVSRERSFVKNWTLADLEGRLGEVSANRNFNSGRAAYNDAQCILCHRFGNDGGWVGPELTGAASKYSRRDLLESLLDPSKVVSDQYQNYTVLRRDGEELSGRIIEEDRERIVMMPNLLTPDKTVAIALREIESRRPDRASPMPSALLDPLTAEEILDLLAYLESAGKSNAPNFRRERRQP